MTTQKPKPWWRSKTFWFGVAVAALPALQELVPLLEASGVRDVVLTGIGILIIVLRAITRRPIATTREGE